MGAYRGRSSRKMGAKLEEMGVGGVKMTIGPAIMGMGMCVRRWEKKVLEVGDGVSA